MAVRPLSQTGLIRVPRNAGQRPLDNVGLPVKRTALARVNDKKTGGFTHATKGFRAISPKRAAAAVITAELRNGQRPFSTWLTARDLKALEASIHG